MTEKFVKDEIKVLVVDDSALMRALISRMVGAVNGLSVADTAINGRFALEKIAKCGPDVILLDIEMPEMNGVEFLREWRRLGLKVPVIVLSAIAERGASLTMECLSLGASDFVQKPSAGVNSGISSMKEKVTALLLAYGGRYKRAKTRDEREKNRGNPPPLPKSALVKRLPGASSPVEAIAIGVSTGGPDALREVFAGISANLRPPVFVVQHMPAGFTREFARSLDKICPLAVSEAEDGEPVTDRHVYIAPGGRHLEVVRRGGQAVLQLSASPPVSGHRPSADVLFASTALVYKSGALGVLMTGMGRDGASQLGTIYRQGGITVAQDEASSVVYGMPRAAFEAGHVMEQIPLARMARRISEIALTGRL